MERVSVTGTRKKDLGAGFEFAVVHVTVEPAEAFEFCDSVRYRDELMKLGVAWPHSAVFGVLNVLMNLETRPLYKVRLTLHDAAYHLVDTTENALREAGRDAGLKIAEAIIARRLLR